MAMSDIPAQDSASDRLGRYLVDSGRIQTATLERALRVGATTGEPLAGLLLKLGLLSERDLADALAQVHGAPRIDADGFPESPIDDSAFTPRFLRESRVLPLRKTPAGLDVAMADPSDDFALKAVSLVAGLPARPYVAVATELDQALERLYGQDGLAADDADPDMDGDGALNEDIETDIERLRDLASEAPVVRLVNRMISDAIARRASDIHLEPYESRLRLRYRVDGVLQDGDSPPSNLRAAIISRIKIMARLNIAERRLPQDGRIKIAVRGSSIDLRVSTLPSMHGEGVVLRVLDRDSVTLDFEALGIVGKTQERLLDALEQPNGIFLVTGPTGSGKTTTLYAALSRLNSAESKIITVEDPVEYQLEGVNQIQVKPDIGLTFAHALRSILRQDPDIILVGEIRDLDTAEIAAQAALTGHLVLSTLHTNSAAASITRLLDMGVADYLVTATLNGIAAQRLVRRLCPDCKTPYRVDDALAAHLGLDRIAPDNKRQLYKAAGCDSCAGTGYRGRLAIMEILIVDDTVRRLVIKGGEARDIHKAACAAGMRSLYDDGLQKAARGETSLEEILRVTREG